MKNFTEWLSNRDPEMLNEVKKPFKNFNKEKNHPEGGLKPSYAKKLGIHAGIETKREAERKVALIKCLKKQKQEENHFVPECVKQEQQKVEMIPKANKEQL